MLEHFNSYRTDVLGIAERGIYKNDGKPRSHIIPESQKMKNILETIQKSFWEYANGNHLDQSLHKCFHHLNSSQALCFNLFFPLVKDGRLNLLTKFLEIETCKPLKAVFEKESELEDVGAGVRKTNFDFYLESATDKIFFEVKYTEDGFGGTKKDSEHRKKFRTVYKQLAADASCFLTKQCQEENVFLENYQLLRNLVHISPKSYVVFVYSTQNEKIAQQATMAKRNFLTEEGKKKIRLVEIEKLIEYLKGYHPDKKPWDDFTKKYLNIVPTSATTKRNG